MRNRFLLHWVVTGSRRNVVSFRARGLVMRVSFGSVVSLLLAVASVSCGPGGNGPGTGFDDGGNGNGNGGGGGGNGGSSGGKSIPTVPGGPVDNPCDQPT